MGYLTTYSLELLGDLHTRKKVSGVGEDGKPATVFVDELIDEDDVIRDLEKIVGSRYFLEGECKWYDHDRDMKQISLKYPTIVFELSGDGEEQGDMWRKYYQNGKVQVARAKITFDEFDPKKLA